MQLQFISIARLIIDAGGDPWAINDSLQAGRPAQISDLAQAFHDAGQSTTASNTASRHLGIGRTASTQSTTPPKCSA
jgi:hypothetical protein